MLITHFLTLVSAYIFQPFYEYQENAVLCGAMEILAPKSRMQSLEIPRFSHD